MHVSNLKIGIRLAILAGLLLFAVSVVGVTGWRALSAIDARAIKAADQAAQMQIAIDTARHAQVQFKIQIQEWKNTLLRGNDPAQFDKYRQAFIKTGEAAQAGLGRLADLLAKNGLDRAAADESRQALVQLQQKYLDALKQYDTANPDSARVVDAAVKGMDRGPTEKIDAIVATVLKQSKTLADGSMAELNSGYRDASTMLLSLNILAVLFGIATTVWLGRSITRPLRDAVTVAKTVASGDLTSRIDVKSRDETGELLQALKDMNDSLVRIVHEVRGGTDTIASATRQISSGNAALSSRTEAQAASLQETASSMEELTSTVKQNADNARQANQLATTASEIAVQGGAVVAQVVDTMGSINASAKKIVDIISIIDGIAFQTNILALNAAVEAARAGEQGRGFAVVASEVRSLAQRSAQAAKEIKILIDDSVHQVETGSRLVDRAGTTMHEVVTSIKRVTDIMSEITAAGQEQSAGIDQIHQAIVHVDEATQQNAALVEESAAASEALQTQTHKLEQTVGVFRLDHGAAATAVAIRG